MLLDRLLSDSRELLVLTPSRHTEPPETDPFFDEVGSVEGGTAATVAHVG